MNYSDWIRDTSYFHSYCTLPFVAQRFVALRITNDNLALQWANEKNGLLDSSLSAFGIIRVCTYFHKSEMCLNKFKLTNLLVLVWFITKININTLRNVLNRFVPCWYAGRMISNSVFKVYPGASIQTAYFMSVFITLTWTKDAVITRFCDVEHSFCHVCPARVTKLQQTTLQSLSNALTSSP